MFLAIYCCVRQASNIFHNLKLLYTFMQSILLLTPFSWKYWFLIYDLQLFILFPTSGYTSKFNGEHSVTG